MTRNNDSSYREKGRAVFLAAIMVVSVVGMSAAFAGSAAAEQPKELSEGSGSDNFDELSAQNRYVGQEFNINDSRAIFNNEEQVYLASAASINDSGAVVELGSSIPYTNATDEIDNGEGDIFRASGLELDVDPGTYVISTDSSNPQGDNVNLSNTFSVVEQDFSADFDDSSIDEFDNSSEVSFSAQNRPSISNDYNVTVRVTGPDGNQLDAQNVKQLLNLQDGSVSSPSGDADAVVQNIDFTAANFLDDYDIDDDDIDDDLEDDGYVTFDADQDTNFSSSVIDGDDDLFLNATNLNRGEGLPDRGEYEFEFITTDTGATATGAITIGEADEDASFEEGAQTVAAGDIADFSVDLSDAVGPDGNSAYVQIGGEDSDFVDVLYIEADDAEEPVDVQINTRLLGTDAELGAVYDDSNTASFESAMHGDLSTFSEDDDLFGDDGTKGDDFDQYVRDLGITGSGEDRDQQLTRPLQPTDYRIQVAGTTGLGTDEAVFDADPGGDANNQLDSKTLRLDQPTIEGVTIHTAPEEDADDITNAEELVSAATPISETGGEIGVNDRLVVQFEANGIFGGGIVQRADSGPASESNSDFDRLSEGASSQVLNALTDGGVSNESVSLSIEAGETTGNVDVLELDLTGSSTDGDTYVVADQANGQFFVVADTSSDNAFTGGGGEAPDSSTQFTAELEYDADNDDDRAEFRSDTDPKPFEFTDSSVNYPYLAQGETLSASTEFTMEPQSISYDSVDEDDNVQIENTEEATVSASTNVAPGSDAEIRISGDGFQQGQSVNVTSDGSISTTFDTSNLEVGDDVELDFRVGGSSVSTDTGVIVEAVEEPADDGEETNETDEPADDGEEEPADDGEEEPADDGEEDDSTDDGTPGFGAVVALIALIGAALLAVRRQN